MKITDYPVITSFTEDQVLLADGNEGTKNIKVADAIMAALHLMSPANHRLVFRGKNLGSVVTTEQKAAIQAGTFEGLWLGDYWVINGINWRIVDFDYWYNTGDTAFTKHHLVIMPDAPLYQTVMNSTATTDGGYIGSAMYQTNLAEAKTIVSSAFGNSVLTHRDQFSSKVTSGHPSTVVWVDSSVDLPSEVMMCGTRHQAPMGNGSAIANTILSKTQLALFKHSPEYIFSRSGGMWLNDVATSANFVYIASQGNIGYAGAANTIGVRPVFAIG